MALIAPQNVNIHDDETDAITSIICGLASAWIAWSWPTRGEHASPTFVFLAAILLASSILIATAGLRTTWHLRWALIPAGIAWFFGSPWQIAMVLVAPLIGVTLTLISGLRAIRPYPISPRRKLLWPLIITVVVAVTSILGGIA